MRVLGSSVLVFEAIIALLFIPVAYFAADRGMVAVWAGLAVAVLAVLAAGLITRPYGVALGWVVQVLILACGVLSPWMFVVGGIFAVLWWAAIHFGRKAERIRADAGAATGSAGDSRDAPGPSPK